MSQNFSFIFPIISNVSYFLRHASVRNLTTKGVHPFTVVFYLSVAGGLSTSLLWIFKGDFTLLNSINTTTILIILISCIIGTLTFFLQIWLSRNVEVTYMNAVMPFYSLFTSIFAYLILNEHLTRFNYIGLIIIAFSTLIINISSQNKSVVRSFKLLINDKFFPHLILMTLLFGLQTPLGKYSCEKIGLFNYLLIYQFATFPFLLFFLIFKKIPLRIKNVPHKFAILPSLFAIMAFTSQWLGYFLNPIGIAEIIKVVAIPINGIIAFFFLKEKNVKYRTFSSIAAGFGGAISAIKP